MPGVNYDKRYPPDGPGEENGPDSRFFKAYLEEAEIFDKNIVKHHMARLDAFLIFAALFSAVIVAIVVESSKDLKPDQAEITNNLLRCQIEILKVVGNTTAIAEIRSCSNPPDSVTHSALIKTSNIFLFLSLVLSIIMAVVSVCAQQCLQSHAFYAPGSARRRVLIRQLRFMSWQKWKLQIMIESIPSIFFASVLFFLLGVHSYTSTLYPDVTWIFLATFIIIALGYVGMVLAAFIPGCPYQIAPLLNPRDGYAIEKERSQKYLLQSISWLHDISLDTRVRQIAAQTLGGKLCSTSSPLAQEELPVAIVHTASQGLFEGEDVLPDENVPEKGSSQESYNLSVWVRAIENLLDSASKQVVLQHLGSDIFKAARMGRKNHVALILQYGIPIDDKQEDKTPLYIASSMGHAEVVKVLLEKSADVNMSCGKDGSALQTASQNGHRDIVQLLVDKGANIDQHDGSALYAAVGEGHSDVVQLLLEKGADVNNRDGEHRSALQEASYKEHWDIVQLLLNNEADVNLGKQQDDSALQRACIKGIFNIVAQLLEKGADVTLTGGWYGSALHAASRQGHQDIVTLMLENGTNVNLTSGSYWSVLEAASSGGHHAIAQLLLKNGADVNLAGGVYGSPLQAASCKGHPKVVQLLLDKGANVNMEGGYYGSALQAAAASGHRDVVQLLLDNGADVNLRGGYGSALQAAIVKGHYDIEQLLRQHGAQ